MSFNGLRYIPCLRWKMGEYQAVFRLPDATKGEITPLIEIPEPGWDFDEKKEKKSIDQRIEPFAKRICNKWGNAPCFVDLSSIKCDQRMGTGSHPVEFVFEQLRSMHCHAIPVIVLSKDKNHKTEIKKVLRKDNYGACLRVSIEEAYSNSFSNDTELLLKQLAVDSANCDFVLDLNAPSFVPLKGFLKVVDNIINGLPYLDNWRSLTLLGTSVPESMSGVKRGASAIQRYEWQLYKVLIKRLKQTNSRCPAFGDYTISHPAILQLDMKKVKPATKIIYTIDDEWYIVKGKSYKDYGLEQYTEHSKEILKSGHYCGVDFSWGDTFIEKCANGGNTSSLTMWKQIGINHHIEKVTQDIASFYASLNIL